MTEESLGTEKLEHGTGEAIAAIKDKNMPLMGFFFFFLQRPLKIQNCKQEGSRC